MLGRFDLVLSSCQRRPNRFLKPVRSNPKNLSFHFENRCPGPDYFTIHLFSTEALSSTLETLLFWRGLTTESRK
jgi:hypothetical protein